MTKISQLSDIGSNIAADDEFVIRDVSDASTPNKKVTVQYIFNGFFGSQSIDSFSDVDTTTAAPVSGESLVWNGSNWVPSGASSEANKITDGAADEAVVEAVASGLNGYINTTISGANSARTTISGYFENASGVGGVLYPVVTQVDIGTAPNEVPLAGMLGELAFLNYPFLRGGSDTATTSGTVTIDSSAYERFNYTASMATGVTVQFSNMTNGREVQLYIRNTNATARAVAFEASTTTTGFTAVNLAGASPPGGPSVSGVTLSGSTGTALLWVGNINGTIVGGIS